MAKKYIKLPSYATKVEPGKKDWFIQKSYSLMKSTACKSLTNGAYRVYDAMMFARQDSKMNHPKGFGNGCFIFPCRYYLDWGLTKRTVLRSIQELVEKGFLKIVLNGKTQRKDSVYCFSNKWKEQAP